MYSWRILCWYGRRIEQNSIEAGFILGAVLVVWPLSLALLALWLFLLPFDILLFLQHRPPRPLTKEERATLLRNRYEQKCALARQIPDPDERTSFLVGLENAYRAALANLIDE